MTESKIQLVHLPAVWPGINYFASLYPSCSSWKWGQWHDQLHRVLCRWKWKPTFGSDKYLAHSKCNVHGVLLKNWCFQTVVLQKTLAEKAMAPHSSTLAWKIPWTEEPGGLQSMGSLRVRHDWATSLSLFTFMHWRRKWQPTPVFLPGESQGQRSLVDCCLWGCTKSDMTEVT